MKLREDLNNLVKKYQRGGLKRLLDEENISDSNSILTTPTVKTRWILGKRLT